MEFSFNFNKYILDIANIRFIHKWFLFYTLTALSFCCKVYQTHKDCLSTLRVRKGNAIECFHLYICYFSAHEVYLENIGFAQTSVIEVMNDISIRLVGGGGGKNPKI